MSSDLCHRTSPPAGVAGGSAASLRRPQLASGVTDAGDDPAARAAVVDDAVGEREEREVAADADAAARVDARADLAHEDRARVHVLAREDLDAAALAVAVAAVARAALSLLVRHRC